MTTSFDVDKFCDDALAASRSDSYKEFIDAKLPNEGENLEDICRTGAETLKRNSDVLHEVSLKSNL